MSFGEILKGLLAAWKDHNGKASMVRVLASAIIVSILGMLWYVLLKRMDLPINVTTLSEFLVTAALGLLGVNSVIPRMTGNQTKQVAPVNDKEKKDE